MEDPLQSRLASRLEELRKEYESGEQQLAALEARCDDLRATMLRISGAIQILEEELAKPGTPGDTEG